jgi:hypothetical protein
MIHDKQRFGIGVALMAVFVVALVLIFRPMFADGKNALDYLDGVFNSTSKASAYYIPAAKEKAAKLSGSALAATITAKSPEQALRTEKLFRAAGAGVTIEGTKLSISGDLGRIVGEALADADAMFKNDGARVSGKYGFDGRRVLYAWHGALGEIVRELNRQERFKDAAVVRDALTKGLEPAYNYYGVTAVAMKDMIWIALAALIGYVVYTVWYGYAILYLFEGWGLNLEH